MENKSKPFVITITNSVTNTNFNFSDEKERDNTVDILELFLNDEKSNRISLDAENGKVIIPKVYLQNSIMTIKKNKIKT